VSERLPPGRGRLELLDASAPAAQADPAPRTLDEFMALALAMEAAAAERYAELADTMQEHNNTETADLFRRMAAIEMEHAREIQARIAELAPPGDGAKAPAPPRARGAWAERAGAAESADPESLHYLMLPWHALQIALENERRAERFFVDLAAAATSDSVREAALRLAAEEREHVALVEAWLARTPAPSEGWADDPDPPRYTE
jgi:rubrerythrin